MQCPLWPTLHLVLHLVPYQHAIREDALVIASAVFLRALVGCESPTMYSLKSLRWMHYIAYTCLCLIFFCQIICLSVVTLAQCYSNLLIGLMPLWLFQCFCPMLLVWYYFFITYYFFLYFDNRKVYTDHRELETSELTMFDAVYLQITAVSLWMHVSYTWCAC